MLFQTESRTYCKKAHSNNLHTHINAMDEKEGEGVKVFRLKWPIIFLEPPDHGSEEPPNGADKGAALVNGSLFSEDDNRLIGLSHGLKMFSSLVDESPRYIEHLIFSCTNDVMKVKMKTITFQGCQD